MQHDAGDGHGGEDSALSGLRGMTVGSLGVAGA